MEPKISVIVPTYNAEDYLMNAIESVINQSIGFENIELILIDDNSTDKTKYILKSFSDKYSNIKVIFLEKKKQRVSLKTKKYRNKKFICRLYNVFRQ